MNRIVRGMCVARNGEPWLCVPAYLYGFDWDRTATYAGFIAYQEWLHSGAAVTAHWFATSYRVPEWGGGDEENGQAVRIS